MFVMKPAPHFHEPLTGQVRLKSQKSAMNGYVRGETHSSRRRPKHRRASAPSYRLHIGTGNRYRCANRTPVGCSNGKCRLSPPVRRAIGFTRECLRTIVAPIAARRGFKWDMSIYENNRIIDGDHKLWTFFGEIGLPWAFQPCWRWLGRFRLRISAISASTPIRRLRSAGFRFFSQVAKAEIQSLRRRVTITQFSSSARIREFRIRYSTGHRSPA